MWSKTADGSVVDSAGKVIFFSTERFVNDICLGACCFICGVDPNEREFNNEHIIPVWLLRLYGMFERTINLPNGSRVRYDRYTVPCCKQCNTLLGEIVEQPISEIVRRGRDAITDSMRNGYSLNFLVWMGLIFVKTHLKDRLVRVHKDSRSGTNPISDAYEYDWEYLHHIHSAVRCFYTGCSLDHGSIGSSLTLAVRKELCTERFDYSDLYLGQSALVRLDDIGLVAVFNDAGGAISYFHKTLMKIVGPVTALQLREVMVELAFLNLHLRDRPTFHSEIDLINETCRIRVGCPQYANLEPLDYSVRGKLLHHAVGDWASQFRAKGLNESQIIEAIRAGKFTFLFDDNGNFISDSTRFA